MTAAVVNMCAFGRIRITSLIIILLLWVCSPCIARRSSGGTSHGRYSHSSHGGGGYHSHTYPISPGYSGTGSGNLHSNTVAGAGSGSVHSYPASTGLSGNNQNSHITKQTSTHQYNNPSHGTKTEVHHHYHQNYHYSPPQQVSYGSVSYPVYHAQPPVYVYEYRDSGSRFATLLTGLALYNLGRMSAHHDHQYHYDPDRRYESAPGEMCKLGIRRKNGDYEETRVDCELMTSFIWESDMQTPQHATTKPIHTVSTSVVNVTHLQTGEAKANGSVTTITITNTTVVDALKEKGQSIEVTPDMICYMIRISRTSNLRKEIKCGILQAYAQNSWRRNSCEEISSSIVLIFTLLLMCEVF